MANVDAPMGFRYAGNLCVGRATAQSWTCNIPATDTDTWYIGDGVVVSAACTDATGFYPGVNLATAGDGNPITGVVTSFEPPSGYEHLVYRQDTVCYKVNVCLDPFAIYEIQGDDDATTSWTYADVWGNAIIVAGVGSKYTGLSGWELDGSTAPSADSSNQVMIVALARRSYNVGATAHSNWLVNLSHSQLRECTTAGDGVLGLA